MKIDKYLSEDQNRHFYSKNHLNLTLNSSHASRANRTIRNLPCALSNMRPHGYNYIIETNVSFYEAPVFNCNCFLPFWIKIFKTCILRRYFHTYKKCFILLSNRRVGSHNPPSSGPVGSHNNPPSSGPVGSHNPPSSGPVGSHNPPSSGPVGSHNPPSSEPNNLTGRHAAQCPPPSMLNILQGSKVLASPLPGV